MGPPHLHMPLSKMYVRIRYVNSTIVLHSFIVRGVLSFMQNVPETPNQPQEFIPNPHQWSRKASIQNSIYFQNTIGLPASRWVWN